MSARPRGLRGGRVVAGPAAVGPALARPLRPALLVLLALAVALGGCGRAAGSDEPTRMLVDMGGRRVAVPQTIDRVLCSNPIGTVDVYMLGPELLAGWNFKPSGVDASFIPERYLDLPALGVWMGSGATPNLEEVLAADPDVILCFWSVGDAGVRMADLIQDDTGIPVILVDCDIRSTPASFRFLGELLGREQRAEELAAYCRDRLDVIRRAVAAVPATERKTVFMAEGQGGLQTDPVGSLHVQDTFELLGLANVVDLPGAEGKGMGMPTVSIEQVIAWQPDVVLVSDYSMSDTQTSDLVADIHGDLGWREVAAVREGSVYRIPQSPFSWFGRPPSAARILGCLWLTRLVYPETSDIRLAAETKEFYRLFYRVDLSDKQLASLLRGSTQE